MDSLTAPAASPTLNADDAASGTLDAHGQDIHATQAWAAAAEVLPEEPGVRSAGVLAQQRATAEPTGGGASAMSMAPHLPDVHRARTRSTVRRHIRRSPWAAQDNRPRGGRRPDSPSSRRGGRLASTAVAPAVVQDEQPASHWQGLPTRNRYQALGVDGHQSADDCTRN